MDERNDLRQKIADALLDPQAPWYGSDLVNWVDDYVTLAEKTIAHQSGGAKVSWHEYAMSCFNCGTQENLCMFAHRNKNGNMVGWIFACESCQSVIGDNGLDIKLSS